MANNVYRVWSRVADPKLEAHEYIARVRRDSGNNSPHTLTIDDDAYTVQIPGLVDVTFVLDGS